jgi:carbonic anhydrase/acetyltransferase-like protein (isoleucine patch superfamily)
LETDDFDMRTHDGHTPERGARVWIDPAATVIGQVRLGDDVSIWPGTVLRGDVNRIEVGARSNIQDGTICHVTHDGPYSPGGLPLILGEDITVGHAAVLHACTIGDRCLIGMGALVLDGAVIEDGRDARRGQSGQPRASGSSPAGCIGGGLPGRPGN